VGYVLRNFEERPIKRTQPKRDFPRISQYVLPIIYRLRILGSMGCEQMILFCSNFATKSDPQGAWNRCDGSTVQIFFNILAG